MEERQDLISRQAILKHIEKIRQGLQFMDDIRRASIVMTGMYLCEEAVRNQPSAQQETCEGCKHLGKWEQEVEYGYPSPCTLCKRRVEDHYEK